LEITIAIGNHQEKKNGAAQLWSGSHVVYANPRQMLKKPLDLFNWLTACSLILGYHGAAVW
jgi:hypothetical protein